MMQRYRRHLSCRQGCDLCCQRKFSVTAVEAYNIAAAFRKLPPGQQQMIRQTKSSCTFLVNGSCSIYGSRPLICRTFGLPSIHRTPEDQPELSWCELNFTAVEEGFALQPDGIIDIDTLNLKLSGVNALFLRESGNAVERFAMDEIPEIEGELPENTE